MVSAEHLPAILKQLERVSGSGSQFKACCPAHDDRNASLSVGIIDGFVKLNCHAGCHPRDVWQLIEHDDERPIKQPSSKQTSSTRQIVATYIYTDATGQALYEKVRYEPKDFRLRYKGADGQYVWKEVLGPTRPDTLYRHNLLAKAQLGDTPLCIVEGEKDVLALEALGFLATCNTHGASQAGMAPKWRQHHAHLVALFKRIIVIRDNDDAGQAHALAIHATLRHARIVTCPQGKDVSDFIAAVGPQEAKAWLKGQIEAIDRPRPANPPKPPISTRIELAANPDAKALIAEISALEPIDQAIHAKRLAAQLQIPLRTINEQIALNKKDAKAKRLDAKKTHVHTAIDAAYAAIADRVVIPLDHATRRPRIEKAWLIVTNHSAGAQQVLPFWGATNTPSPWVTNAIAEVLEGAHAGFIESLDTDINVRPEITQIRLRLAMAVQNGSAGHECEVHYGPVLREGKFRVKTDLEEGYLLLRADHFVVDSSTAPTESPSAWADFKRACGATWLDFAATILAALTNRYQDSKHVTLICGSAKSGKSKVALMVGMIVEGRELMTLPLNIEKNMAHFLNSRMVLMDNVDFRMKAETMSEIARLMTSSYSTVDVRYTKAGEAGDSAFPVVTSILPDLFDSYRPLKSRTVTIHREADPDLARWVPQNWRRIARDVTPHFWWLAERYAEDASEGMIDLGDEDDCRNRAWAEARYWLEKVVCEHADDRAKAFLRDHADEQNGADDEDPFVISFDKTMTALGSADWLRASDLIEALREHASEIFQGPLGQSKRQARTLREMIARAQDGGIIGGRWRVKLRKQAGGLRYWIEPIRRQENSD